MLNKLRDEIFNYLASIGKGERIATRIDFEGPRLVIYTDKPEIFAERNKVAKELVNLIKKRVIIRPDESIRKPVEEAKKTLEEFLRGVEYSEYFDENFGEVMIESKDPRVYKILDQSTTSLIEQNIGWIVNVYRSPLLPSKTVEKMKRYIFGDTERRVEILRTIGERVFRDQLFEPGEVTVTVLGAGMQVGRSAFLVRTRESQVLLDCGINAGASKYIDMLPRFDVYPELVDSLDAVVITHSHMDHHGALPLLFKYGYRGPIYMTEPTLPLLLMEQLDYVNLAGKEGFFPLYTENEVRLLAQYAVTLKYGVVTNITPDIRLTFYNAGHIMGSSIAHLHIGEGFHNLVYTGDFKFEKTRMLDPATSKFLRLESLIIESTYGATPVPYTREESEKMVADYIGRTIQRGGVVIIPVPSVGRAQEIMLVLKNLFESKQIPETPIFLDGLLIEATAIHTMYPEYLSEVLQREIEEHGNVFLSEYFTIVKSHQHRDEILQSREPSIIIATSGMLEGGPVLKYFREFAGDGKNLLLFVSYQVEGTLGRKLLKGMNEVQMINEDGKQEIVKVALEIQKVDGFSGHSSRQQIINYIRRISPKPKQILFVHGEPESTTSIASTVKKMVPAEIYTPKNLETITLT
jgi:KH/beta-lactamase-domain protein